MPESTKLDAILAATDPCTCGGHVYYDDHGVGCPASLYQAGIQRGRKEAREACVSELRLMATGADENHDAYVARCLEVAADALQLNGETAR